MVEPEVDLSSERDERRRAPRPTVLIYATHTALEGLDEHGEVVSPRTPDERIDWLIEQLRSRCLERPAGGTTYVVEHARRPSIRERLLRVQPGERYVLKDGSGDVERIDEPLSDLASFLVWEMARGEADRYALVVLGDALDVEDFEDAAKRALEGPARALTSLIGPSVPSRGLTKSLPDKGSRPLSEGLSDKGSRPLTKGLSDKGSRPLSEGLSDKGSRPLSEGLSDKGSRPLSEGLSDKGSRPLERARRLERAAQHFARGRRLVDALAGVPCRGRPVVELLATDDASLRSAEIGVELHGLVGEVLAVDAPALLADGPLASVLEWADRVRGRAPDGGPETEVAVEELHHARFEQLRDACRERLDQLAPEEIGVRELLLAVSRAPGGAACYDPQALREAVMPALHAFGEAVGEAIERAEPRTREVIFRRAAGARRRSRGSGTLCDLGELIDALVNPAADGWSPSAALYSRGVELRAALRKALRRAGSFGLQVCLPIAAHDPVEPAFLDFSVLVASDGGRPSGWARMLSALRSVAVVHEADDRGRAAAVAEVRMRHDMASFWVRGTTEDASMEASRREVATASGPWSQWGVLLCATDGRMFECDAPQGAAVRVATNTAGERSEGLDIFLPRAGRSLRAHQLCLVVRNRPNPDGAAPSALGERREYMLPRLPIADYSGSVTVTQFAELVAEALAKIGRSRLDLLILDIDGGVSFEMAYELKGLARRLVSVSDLGNLRGGAHKGFDYTEFLASLERAADPSAGELASVVERLERELRVGARDLAASRRELRGAMITLAADAAVDAREEKEKSQALSLDLTVIDVLARRVHVLCRHLFNNLDNPSVWEWLNTILDGYYRTYGALWPLNDFLSRLRGDHLDAYYRHLRGEALRGRPQNPDLYDDQEAYPADPDAAYRACIDELRARVDAANEALTTCTRHGARQLLAYFPRQDNVMNAEEYLALSYHQEVHTYALLSAVRLLKDRKAHQLWDVVSTAIAYTSGRERSALLNRLAYRDGGGRTYAPAHRTQHAQFASLASPPMITLSIEADSPYRLDSASGHPYADDEGALRYRVRLASNQEYATLPQALRMVNPSGIDDALAGLDMLLRSGRATDAEWNYLQSIGASLGEDIIGELRGPLASLRGDLEREQPGTHVHLALRIPRELMRYPWELMVDGHDLLARRYAVGRQVWTDSGRALKPEARDVDPLRVLIVGDPALDARFPADAQLPGARAEAEEVAAQFEALDREFGDAMDFRRERDVFIHTSLTRAAMRRLIRDRGYDIVHFAGHGIYVPGHPERSAWLMSDGPLWALELRNTLAWSKSPPWLIYANACETGMSPGEGGSRFAGEVFGLATACINQGTRAYVAPLWPISDAAGRFMATAFYEELLLRRSTLGAALQRARLRAQEVCAAKRGVAGLFDISWASVILYGDPSASLADALDTAR